MDSSLAPSIPLVNQDDEWDTDGFVIPSVAIDDPDYYETLRSPVTQDQTPKKQEGIYMGMEPRRTQLSHRNQIEPSPPGRKQKLKHKLKQADKRSSGSGTVCENNLEHLRELVGVGTQNSTSIMPKSSPRDWLDPHCHESEFERQTSQ